MRKWRDGTSSSRPVANTNRVGRATSVMRNARPTGNGAERHHRPAEALPTDNMDNPTAAHPRSVGGPTWNDATRLRRDRSPNIVIRNASIPELNNSNVAPRKSRLDSRLENRIEIRRRDRGATNRRDESLSDEIASSRRERVLIWLRAPRPRRDRISPMTNER
jgi:hypothetical protein